MGILDNLWFGKWVECRFVFKDRKCQLPWIGQWMGNGGDKLTGGQITRNHFTQIKTIFDNWQQGLILRGQVLQVIKDLSDLETIIVNSRSLSKDRQSGMKIHECSCSFMFAVFNYLNGTRVCFRSCSKFSNEWAFVFVRVQYFTEKCVRVRPWSIINDFSGFVFVRVQ